ncbi:MULTISPECIES: PTS mannitol transporter subunit IICB [Leifsonia]|uniref:PTS system mannitol-specific EIICB component n=1 Tax=Leifsonia soli TaxID=582665 RepID=A0A852T3S0_9MICO|nr:MULTISPECIES: PTS mannitol transporter subunit IICB [Leifsonia]NYD75482.1 PTS system mannitol-specific IIC component [Leifsonia soli]SEB13215.1 PTS system, mannitol-specific IIC component [Leifsonia sp. 21MFCrub1.1]
MTSATQTSTTASAPKKSAGARVHVQRFGTFLSNMVMPNIAAFIAWGIVTALFIEKGPFPNKDIASLVGPMITYLLPLLLANTGGRLVYGVRGGVVGTIAAMGVIVGTDIPMFIGAMIMGPLGGYLMKVIDRIWEGKIKAGFEMLVNNFSAGILGFLLAIGAFFGIAPLVQGLSKALEAGVDWLVSVHLLPLVSILVEPGKVLFLNNAINHGVFTPIGTLESQQAGKSILFLIETNPGPGAGILLAWAIFGLGAARAAAPGAFIIQFFGGIHEIYFPYVLMKPILIIGAILGGMTGVAVNVAFQTGLRAPAAPGSVFAIFAQAPVPDMLGIALAIVAAAAVSFTFTAIVLRSSRKRDLLAGNAGDLSAAVAQTEANKGKSSSVLGSLVDEAEHDTGDAQGDATDRLVRNIVFACDAGMGSSAMGASVLRNKMKKAGVEGVTVTNQAISNLDGTADLVITQQQLTDRAKGQSPDSIHVSVDNFMNSPKYDEVVDLVKNQRTTEDASK